MLPTLFYKTKLSSYYKRSNIYRSAILHILGNNARKFEQLNIIICSPKDILKINKQFLGHNYVTDVISFATPTLDKKVLGDIFVCFKQVSTQATLLKRPIREELLTVILHGVLHLIGYDDDTVIKRNKMNAYAESVSRLFLHKESIDKVSKKNKSIK